ncbi:MAG: alpha-ketoacid dehydrogenase subunit beta [Chloroflexi bacterium]|nr:alpha-ketoacid dehydrogenase subunit beta [Chloroflexota bacterium]
MKSIRYHKAITEALAEELERDSRVLILGEDVGMGTAFASTRGLVERFGTDRIIDTPISESGIVGLAVGAALNGLRPIVELTIMDFVTVCMDPLVNHMAKLQYMFPGQHQGVPLVIMASCGGRVGAGPQHSQSLEAWFAHTPGIKVVMPSTSYDAKGLLKAAVRDNNPVMYLYHKGLLRAPGEVPEGEYTVPLGVAETKRAGKDVTVVATAEMVSQALTAAQDLEKAGIDVEVVDPRTIYPLDIEPIIASVKKTSRLVVAHEAVRFCGLGAEIAATVTEMAFDYLDAPVKRIGAPSVPIPFAPSLENAVLPGARDIVQACREVCGC